jgi:hypothetical protein
MIVNGAVYEPMFEHNGKWYLRVTLDDSLARRVQYMQSKQPLDAKHIDNPLTGNVLTIKVPYRYNRVMCRFEGAPVQSLKRGDTVSLDMIFMGRWFVGDYSGYTWKMTYIKLIDSVTT